MKTKNILLSVLVIVLVIVLEGIVMAYYQKTIEVVKNPIVTMEVENYGTVIMELYPDKAPNTVANFVKLINEGFYNGKTFFRAISGSLIQGGDIQEDGKGDAEFTIPGEFFANGFEKNNLRHEKGTLTMARANYSALSTSLAEEGYNSGATQFVILNQTTRYYDGLYCAFGKVLEGQEIIETLTNLPHSISEDGTESEDLETPVHITRMTVDTFGVDYGEPERLEPFDYYSWMMKQYQFTTTTGE